MNVHDAMFFAYLKELEGTDAIYNDYGFITYSITGDECYISHFYIKPDSRGSGKGKALYQTLKRKCKKAGARIMSCNLFKKDQYNNINLDIYKSVGFKKTDETPYAITMVKEL